MSSNSPPDSESESVEALLPPVLNRLAVVALVGGGVVAFLAFFSMPLLLDLGFAFWQAFALISGIEFLAAIVCGVSIYRLYG